VPAVLSCPACGASIPAEGRFCDQCGASLGAPAPLPGERQGWVVGRDSDCDLVVEESTVSGRHCRLTEHPDGIWLEDLGSANGTFVNGQRLAFPVRITPGDRVTLGQSVPLPWPRAPWPEGRRHPGALEAPLPTLPAWERIITIGRDPDNSVVLDYPMISGRHARILVAATEVLIEDLGSTNGTALGGPGQRITAPTPLSTAETVYFGSMPVPASRLLRGGLSLGKAAHSTLEIASGALLLGRDPRCDVVLDDPMVSWHHARLLRDGDRLTVEDLGSTNGTFLNGQRIRGQMPAAVGDEIGVASFAFQVRTVARLEQRDYRGNVTIEAVGVGVEIPSRSLIEAISLTLYPSELIGLMGPSGCGKSTLIHALDGYSRPSHGSVLFNQQDLYTHHDQFRMHIGYVPQDDIIHGNLSVRQALYYSARLRLPADLSDGEIDRRIAAVLAQLGLTGTEDTLIGSPVRRGISGGQRKRVNLAMELITEPFVLFLDEPTSGLSSEDALAVMKVLRSLADSGKTILLSIHQPSLEVFRLMDSVTILSQDTGTPRPARLAYFGPAWPDSVHFFNPDLGRDPAPSPDLLLRGLATRGTEEWAALYASSHYHEEYVEQRAGTNPARPPEGPDGPSRHTPPGLAQWWTLVRRAVAIKAQDSWNTGILVAQAPFIALLIVLVFGRDGGATPAKALFVMVIAALWFGCSNSAREIVSEWAIYHRERMVNLKIPSYVASKLTVLGVVCVVQCLLLLGIVHGGCDLAGPWIGSFFLLLLTALVGVAMGLLISALARTSEVAISVVPVILLPMVILGGMLRRLGEMSGPMTALAHLAPSRWAFEGLLILESGARPLPADPGTADAAAAAVPDLAELFFPLADRSGLPFTLFVLGLLLAVLLAAVLGIMRHRDAH